MSKQYEVKITAYTTVVVTADNEEEACEYASDAVNFGDFEEDEARVKPIPPEQLNGFLRHSPAVAYDLEEAQKFARANPFKKIPKRLLKKGD